MKLDFLAVLLLGVSVLLGLVLFSFVEPLLVEVLKAIGLRT